MAMTPLKWTQPTMPHSSLCPQTLASALASPAASKKRGGNNVVVNRLDRSLLFGSASSKLSRTHSCELPKLCSHFAIKASGASSDAFSDEEFSKKIQEVAQKFRISGDSTDSQTENTKEIEDGNEIRRSNSNTSSSSSSSSNFESVESQWLVIHPEPPDWHLVREEIVIQHKANSVDIPLSLRMIKRKKQSQSQVGFCETAYCSVKKAFASMVFIIRELHSYTLQMREHLFFEDLQDIISRVQQEIHASFVWLFQQVFSHTPTFMVYVMILLANFTVHSMASNFAIAAPIESTSTAITEIFSSLESSEESNQKFDSSALKTFSISGPGSRTTSIGGNHGGGGKARPAASGTDGDGWVEKSGGLDHKIIPDGTANQVSPVTAREEESVSGLQERAEELKLWNSIAEEASRMQAEARGDFLDSETIQRFISPVKVELESDEDYPEFFRTELVYRMSLAVEPNNSLLLANFAQFLYLIAHDYDRAEEYFKKATQIEPKDAEAYSKYANFLWVAKKDLWAAEETYLEAISADPENTYYAANYAHFLWNTGAEDTCFPLDGPEEEEEERVCDA
ncbi:hypothetical protein V2J09_019087 [Rumex salicifolius]